MTAILAQRAPTNSVPIEPINLIWLAFALSATASMILVAADGIPAAFLNVLIVVGSGGCGWLWLLARSLFRKEKQIESWGIYIVLSIIAIEGTSNVMGPYSTSGSLSELHHIISNTETFICVGALVMVFAEVFSGYGKHLSKQELRFRNVFVLTLGIMIALTILWVLNAQENSLGGRWKEPVLFSSALVAIIGSRACIAFRKKNPLYASKKSKVLADTNLAKRVMQALQQDRRFATPELKVADLAEILQEQEYKVTQCITGALGFRNFNHLINSHRIDFAKKVLADGNSKDQPILSIAFECGFNSLGPFNRAFKEQVGMTPREFRAAGQVSIS